jgi:hypothetical protein
MNENFRVRDNQAIDAMLAVDLPGSVDPINLPAEIQWMPPGVHEIHASKGGKPVTLTITVDESSAQQVAASFAECVAAAGRVEGDLPYFDFNHDDKEASAWPIGFYWGGDDPQRGGVRAKVNWSDIGKRAVLGKSYRRFSPSFFADENSRVHGAPVNMGGLVNRAAFQKIQPIVSKRVEAEMLSGSASFIEKAKTIARARNVELLDAYSILAREQPETYDQYRADLYGGPVPVRVKSVTGAAAAKARNDEFMIRARSIAEALDLEIGDAYAVLAREQPALYERFRARMFGIDIDRVTVAEVHARAALSPFFVRAKELAAQRGIDITAAYDIVARQNPELYDAYRASL